MSDENWLILGAGFSGRAIARALVARGVPVAGTSRSPEKTRGLALHGMSGLVFDGETVGETLAEALARATHVVVSIAPGEAGDPVLRLLADDLARSPDLKWLAYLSTVGVYGDHDGAWVDEDTPVRPVSQRSVERVEAENGWLAFAAHARKPVAILRLSGIYGPGRNAFCNLAEGTARRLVKPGQVFNRIHVADIAGATLHLAEKGLGGLWNVTDDEPAPPQDVVEHAASVMKIDPPAEQDFATATLSPMARSFYGENKRVSNTRLKASGYRFLYPDYRTAFRAMWADGSWKPDR